jgi:hypothetical protein
VTSRFGGIPKAAANSLRICVLAAVAAGLSPAAPVVARDAKKKAPAAEVVQAQADVPPTPKSAAAARVAQWIAASDDNGEFPYIIIDKQAGRLFLFDADGKSLGDAPVLTGIAEGDEATPGIGAKKLAEIGPAEKTTPAGRFLAKYGRAVGKERVLWVDYHDSVALHAVVTGNKKERRVERLETPTAEDNRITFGCINVPTKFYTQSVRPLFRKSGGMVYVLPDRKPLEEVFPRLRLLPYLDKTARGDGEAPEAQG